MADETIFEIQAEINAYKQLLNQTDYKALKFAEGAITAEDYEEIKQTRQGYRDEVNALEAEIARIEGNSSPYDFTGMDAAEVVRSLSYRPTLDELRQACDWLQIEWNETMTRSQLRALIDAAASAGSDGE